MSIEYKNDTVPIDFDPTLLGMPDWIKSPMLTLYAVKNNPQDLNDYKEFCEKFITKTRRWDVVLVLDGDEREYHAPFQAPLPDIIYSTKYLPEYTPKEEKIIDDEIAHPKIAKFFGYGTRDLGFEIIDLYSLYAGALSVSEKNRIKDDIVFLHLHRTKLPDEGMRFSISPVVVKAKNFPQVIQILEDWMFEEGNTKQEVKAG